MDLSFLEELANEELRFKKFSLVGTGNVQAAGNLKAGYIVNIDRTLGADSGGGSGAGACCDVDNNCTITTPDGCDGTYQGDGVPCDPNPCGGGATGACCIDLDCSILTAADCIAASGYYFGDDTTCEEFPCSGGTCCGPFCTYASCGPYIESIELYSTVWTCTAAGFRWAGAGDCAPFDPTSWCCDTSDGECCGEDTGLCCVEGEFCCEEAPGIFICQLDGQPCPPDSAFDDPFFQNN